jgi:hypothetical protein
MMDLNSRVANGIGRGILAVACSAGLLICAAPVIASTGSSSVDSTPLIAGHTAVAVAACPGPSHITGGGFGIDPPSTPGGNVTTHTTSFHPNDDGTFSALSANSTFGVDSTLTATARCESSRDGKLATIFDGCCTPIDPGHAQPIDLNCLPGTHVVSAGPRSTIGGKMVVVEDRRLTDTTWQITGRVPTASTTSSDIGGWAVCERNGSSRPIIERSTVTPYLEDTRTDGTATCDNRTHVVGGGFLFLPFGPGSVPVPYVDRSVPLGNTGWSVAAYDLSLFNVPPGSTMTTYAYCRSNKPKKKKKKHHHRNGHKKSSKAAAASLQPPAAGALSGLDPVVTYGAPG